MKTHIESVHNGNWHHCDQCEYKAAHRVPLRHILNRSIKKNLRNAMNLFMTVNNIIVINVNTIANKRVLLGNTLNQSIMGIGIIVINVNMKRHKSVQSRHTLNLFMFKNRRNSPILEQTVIFLFIFYLHTNFFLIRNDRKTVYTPPRD